jgi:hypothetical protein
MDSCSSFAIDFYLSREDTGWRNPPPIHASESIKQKSPLAHNARSFFCQSTDELLDCGEIPSAGAAKGQGVSLLSCVSVREPAMRVLAEGAEAMVT